MPTRVDTTHEFDKEIERLGRKYPAVCDAVDELITQTEGNIRPGSRVPGVGATIYKARLPNRSARRGRRGRRGGFRVIYYVKFPDLVYLLTIYSKTEKDSISTAEIRRIVNTVD